MDENVYDDPASEESTPEMVEVSVQEGMGTNINCIDRIPLDAYHISYLINGPYECHFSKYFLVSEGRTTVIRILINRQIVYFK